MWTAPSAAERLKNTFPQSGAEDAGASVLAVLFGDNCSKLTSNDASAPSNGKAIQPVDAVSIAVWMRREEGSLRVPGPKNVVLILMPAVQRKDPVYIRALQAFQFQRAARFPF
jgi:hypothetical protein